MSGLTYSVVVAFSMNVIVQFNATIHFKNCFLYLYNSDQFFSKATQLIFDQSIPKKHS